MSRTWPPAVIRELLARAEALGEARAICETAREAELFRYAVYGFRKVNNIGHDLVITIEDNVVVATKKPTVVLDTNFAEGVI